MAFAQNATLKANTNTLIAEGGSVTFTATASYEGQPSALGWSVELPVEWILASVAGSNVPEIAPSKGTTGTLEFAYTSTPATKAEFTFVVRYPAGATAAKAVSTVLVRANGKLATLTPASVEFGK